MKDGWFHTGDVATVDPHNYLQIVDRKKEIIVSGGENISSLEVEKVLRRPSGGIRNGCDSCSRCEMGRGAESTGGPEARSIGHRR